MTRDRQTDRRTDRQTSAPFHDMATHSGPHNKAYAMLGVIKRNFKYLKTSSFILLYKNMVRSHLDYCSSVWSPYRKGDMDDIEKVQKKATKLIPELKRMNYIDRLKNCQLPTLHYRRIRGDMIETYKIVSGKYDSMAAPMIPGSHSYITRGHDLRLHKSRAKYDLRKYFFSNRVVLMYGILYQVMSLMLIL